MKGLATPDYAINIMAQITKCIASYYHACFYSYRDNSREFYN